MILASNELFICWVFVVLGDQKNETEVEKETGTGTVVTEVETVIGTVVKKTRRSVLGMRTNHVVQSVVALLLRLVC